MRLILAGLLIFTLASLSLAQPRGEIESIGFDGQFRLDCWTPMVVRLAPGSAKAGTYQLQVKQFDESGDRQVFSRMITLNAEDQSGQQRFSMYFVPEPIDGGLPGDGATSLRDLQRRLKVVLTSADGKKPIAELPATSTILAVDPYGSEMSPTRGSKLILCITDGISKPAWPEYLNRQGDASNVVGYTESLQMITLKASDLPDNVLGYEAVDGIVWLNADPAELQRGGENKLQTLREYVRSGGTLVVCSGGNDWQRSLGFGDMLPVTPVGGVEKKDLYPLRKLAESRADDSWNLFTGPFRLAKAEPKLNTVVDEWVEWSKDPRDRSPYIARRGYGLGAVTWVAQDLGDPVLTTRAAPGWAHVWDRVFDWKNDVRIRPKNATDKEWEELRDPYYSAYQFIDLGGALYDVNTSKSVVYVSIALFFFVIYWIVAGPGIFLALVAKRKSHLSWLAYCAMAVLATLTTVLLVKVLLRGSPDLRHISVVKVAPNQPAVVYSRFGLYIPQDGERKIELKDAAPETVTALTSLAVHPNYVATPDYKPGTEYSVPVRDSATPEPAVFTAPYRSTLRKFTARWSGQFAGGIAGDPKIDPNDRLRGLAGRLTNNTEMDFSDVYLAFQVEYQSSTGDFKEDRVIYLPSFKKGQSLDLRKDLEGSKPVGTGGGLYAVPGEGKVLADRIGQGRSEQGWDRFWYDPFNRSSDLRYKDDSRGYLRTFPMLSLFERLPPSRKTQEKGRFDFLRRGGRMLDVSQALSAGGLVILARTEGPIPIPLEVDGSKVAGQGVTFYQFVVPLDRTALDAANAPTTLPTTQENKGKEG